MLMFDAAGTWRAALPLRVQAETTLEATAEAKRDIPRKSILVSDSKSAALSFLFLSHVMICVGAACLDTLGTVISSRWVMATLCPLRNSIPQPTLVYSGCSDTDENGSCGSSTNTIHSLA